MLRQGTRLRGEKAQRATGERYGGIKTGSGGAGEGRARHQEAKSVPEAGLLWKVGGRGLVKVGKESSLLRRAENRPWGLWPELPKTPATSC